VSVVNLSTRRLRRVHLRDTWGADCACVMPSRASALAVLAMSAVILPLLPVLAVAASPARPGLTTAQAIRRAAAVPGILDRRADADDATGVRAAVSAAQAAVSPVDAYYASPAGQLATGPRSNGTAVLSSGRFVTPAGKTAIVDLQPTHIVLTRDATRLLVTSQGLDDDPSADAHTDSSFDRHVDVLSADGQLTSIDRVADADLQYGVVEQPDGTVWVSEGRTGSLGVFTPQGKSYVKSGDVSLGSGTFPWGLAESPDGRYVYAADFQSNQISVVDATTKTVLASVAAGEYPRDLTVSPDGKLLYVTNWGLYNGNGAGRTSPAGSVATPPPSGNYNAPGASSVWIYSLAAPAAPVVSSENRIGRDLNGTTVVSGSLPTSLALSPDATTLAVTAANNDLVELRDAKSGALLRSFDMSVVPGGPTGAAPNAVAWSTDGATLYVTLGGRDAVAAVDPVAGSVTGLIPTGNYPSAVAVSPDGSRLYVASFRGLGAGPNTAGGTPNSHSADKIGTDLDYIDNLLKGTVQDIPLQAACAALPGLTSTVTADNGLVPSQATDPSGGVIPATFGSGPSSTIKHVVFILKENRPYDQVFGDLPGSERDDSVAPFSGSVTPNQHSLATQYAVGDNYYSTAQTSYDGHYVADSGDIDDFAQQVNPSSYANKFATDPFVTSPENLPQGGFTWNNLARSGISFKIYGEATYLVGLGPTALNAGGSPTNPLPPALYALGSPTGSFSPTYPSQITVERPVVGGGSSDEDRASNFLQDLKVMDTTGTVPQFMQLTVPDDHTNGFAPGAPTPQSLVAENDHAVGEILSGLSQSSIWSSTAVFVTEDDTQDGQDHVDASRTFAIVAGAHVKSGYISHQHESNLSLQKTVDLILGAPPTSTDELTATSMADFFTPTANATPYVTRPNVTPAGTNPPYGTSSSSDITAAQRLQQGLPAGIDQGGARFSAALQAGLRGEQAIGTPGLATTSGSVEHTLPAGSPTPVTLPAPPSRPQAGVCGARAAAQASLPEARRPVLLVLVTLVLGAGPLLMAWSRRRRAAEQAAI